mmetsp:Transcript_26529/g.81973  ORF Transcript_26529/g.81973 Transcript_26529/m.81973 type:complete len:184 (-) Transcript_26529:188-739(-)|eukprot:CAMPEP_0174856790 /NCGR_PEP_ID=MMETSP1114-20130205/36220_1 /TAXON_ID=312471 /ORGANISM="Neobodo designis, Strain CCAP 1951/1" /LENGTH=183 /DNA_ID=CAMNT_0016091595 /DNA_START=98 /DNA_END=649 /DNA_ORIENTATION=+
MSSASAVPIDRLSHGDDGPAWSLMELQGTLAPPADAGADEELLLGDVEVAPAIGKRVPCFLKIGTLTVEGDLAKLPRKTALLERVDPAAPCPSPVAGPSAAPTFDGDMIAEALRHEPFANFSDLEARREALGKRARDYGVGPEAGDANGDGDEGAGPRFAVRGFLTERYFLKMKPVRSIPKAT